MAEFGVQPNISLGVTPPQAGGNPLEMVDRFADVQNKLNANKLFQQTFQARQKLGEIMATAPSREAGIARAAQDPDVAPFAGEYLGAVAGVHQALTGIAGQEQSQNDSAQQMILKAAGIGLRNPEEFEPALDRGLSLQPPDVQKRLAPWVKSLKSTLGPVAKVDPARFQAQLGDTMLAAGYTPETMRAITGTIPPTVVSGPGPQGQEISKIIGGPAAGGPGAGPAAPSGAPPGAAGAGSTSAGALFEGPTIAERTYQQGRAEGATAYAQHLQTSTQTAGNQVKILGEAMDALKQIRAGGGAGVRGKVGQLLQAFNFSPDLVNRVANGNLAATQEAEKLMAAAMSSQMDQSLPAHTVVGQHMLQDFRSINPHLDTDPKATTKIYDFWQRMYNQLRDEQSSYNKWTKQKDSDGNPNDPADWPDHWQGEAERKGYISKDVTGLQGKKADFRWVPGENGQPGKVVPND